MGGPGNQVIGRRTFIVGCIRHCSVFIIPEGGQGVFFIIVDDVIIGKPGVGPGMEGGNLRRTPMSISCGFCEYF